MLLNALRPSSNFQALLEAIDLLRRRRRLTLEMTRRDVGAMYAGQVFGAVWAVLHPLSLILLFVFIFGVVFKVRIGGTRELPLDYTTYLVSGFIPWLSFQQSMVRASSCIIGQGNLVKQVVFPLEVLPATAVFASFVPQLVGVAALLVYVLAVHGIPHATYLLLPVLFLIQVLGMLGVAFAFAAIGPFFRDLKDFVQVFSIAGIYLMPVLYLPEWVPALFKPVIYANPFSYMAWCYQDALYYGRFEHPWAWLVFGFGSLLAFCAGYRLFRLLRPHFGNVL